MKRNVSLQEISDGRLYGENDMVRADCHGCPDCFRCCVGMGNSVVLDPFDIYRLQSGEGRTLAEFLSEGSIELNVVDGLVLPNLRMSGSGERCSFLSENGRCGIHESRPGICRLFPLGRYYENGDFRYFLQTGECSRTDRSKVKVSRWIDTPDPGRYHDFLCRWHYYLNALEERVLGVEDSEASKRLNLSMLQCFYLTPYDTARSFYEQFEERSSANRKENSFL